ncbi:hypothetical protein PG994_001003 [Apiospora phragmitis]|uniref:AA1-like domain-containing protein n=1 Tax=Apiospora phragmitis TaxID=2905665 RepID=A0ABR1WSD5_9PEZI
MRCLTLLLVLRLASAAPSQAPSDFTITGLYAEVISHSLLSSYSFDLSTSPKTIATSCLATPQTESNGQLVNVSRTPCADDARYTWAWTIITSTSSTSSSSDSSNPNTLDAADDKSSSTTNTTCNIEYWFEGPHYSLYAAHHVPADQIVWTNQQSPTGTVQAYAGPANFTVPVEIVY